MNTKYSCVTCCYYTNIKHNFDRHLSSKKHNKNSNEINVCNFCNKKYKYLSNLSRHKNKCSNTQKEVKNYTNPEAVETLRDEIKELKNIIIDMAKNKELITTTNTTTNNTVNYNQNQNNQNFNIQIFLNEDCKNAINLVDFIKTIKIELNEMIRIGEVGYVDGISQLLQDKLRKCPIYERPIHYYIPNNKEEKNTLHIRDEDSWKKDIKEVKDIFDKSMYQLDANLNKTHFKYKNKNSKEYKEVHTEINKHSGLSRKNEKEQDEILNKILPQIKVI